MSKDVDIRLIMPRNSRTVEVNPQHEKFHMDMLEFLKKWAGDLPADEMLAIASFLVGQIISMQDKKKYTSATVMEIVAKNVEMGNAKALEDVASGKIVV